MPDPFVGEVRMFAGTVVPTGWALCDGQLLPISQNTALFSLLGTMYGGNGTSTFALPDLRGRVPVHMGQGPGLSNRVQGELLGEEAHTLLVSEMPAHNHTVGASTVNGNSDAADSRVMARSPAAIPQYQGTSDTNLSPSAVANTGGGQPHNNMQPYLCVSFIIALQGIYPPRS